MKLAACQRLSLQPINATWYRAISTEHWGSPLSTAHTSSVTTRFNPGKSAQTPFEILYLAENQIVALYEVGALYGPPERAIADPRQIKMMTIGVSVRLQSVADLSVPGQQKLLGVSPQELTGVWDAFPPGEVPTQRLGAALFATDGIEGFVAISAKRPLSKTLIIFPQKLRIGSELVFTDTITGKTHRITTPSR
jgi:RES domain-containing protein